jgi:hypothetical protein
MLSPILLPSTTVVRLLLTLAVGHGCDVLKIKKIEKGNEVLEDLESK